MAQLRQSSPRRAAIPFGAAAAARLSATLKAALARPPAKRRSIQRDRHWPAGTARCRAAALPPVPPYAWTTTSSFDRARADYVYDLHRDAAHVLHPPLVVAVFENPFGETADHHATSGGVTRTGTKANGDVTYTRARPVTSRGPYKPP